MLIEDEIFKKYEVDINKLEEYGFIKEDNKFIYKKSILNNQFIIFIEYTNKIKGKIIETEYNEEYINFRRTNLGEYNSKIKQEFINVITDIRNNCFIKKDFRYSQTERVIEYIKNKYDIDPEFLWERTPDCCVFRKSPSKKWIGIIMTIDFSKLDNKTGEIEIMNIKLDRNEILSLVETPGFYKAYHMNKRDWISMILNDTISDKKIMALIDESYNIVK